MKAGYKILAASLILAGVAAASYGQAQNEGPDLMISDEACRNMAVYQPGADGDANYKPGVDVTGKPVVEADIASGGISAPATVEFDLTVDMAQYLGYAVSPTPEGQIHIAKITVLPDGRVLRDGEPLEGHAQAALRALCLQKKTEKQP